MHFSVNAAKAKQIGADVTPLRTITHSIKFLPDNDLYKYTVVISKKQGNPAKRNRVRRIIREIMRCNRNRYPNGFYMLYVNKKCDQLKRDILVSDLEKAITKISLHQTIKSVT